MSSIYDYDADLMSELYDMLEDEDIYESEESDLVSVNDIRWSGVAPYTFMGIFSICNLLFSLRYYKGLVRFIYGLKASTLTVIFISHFGILESSKILINNFDRRILKHTIALIHESLSCFYLSISLIMLHELHLCTCRLEVRELKLLVIFQKAGLGLIAIVVMCALHVTGVVVCHNIGNVNSYVWEDIFLMAKPAHSFLRVAFAIIVAYLGFQVMKSQWKSGQFREAIQASSSGSKGYLIMLVLNCQLMQIVSLALHFVMMLWGSMIMRSILNTAVDENGWLLEDALKNSAAAIKKVNQFYMAPDFIGCFELFFIFLLYFYKQWKVPSQ